MTIYYITYITIFLIYLFSTKYLTNDKKLDRKFLCFCSFLIIASLLALRHPSMGHDLRYLSTTGYLGNFDFISTIDWKTIFKIKIQNYERGYIIFNKLLSEISTKPQFLLIACAVIPMALISRTIYQESEFPVISFIVYLGLPSFLMNYSGLRQALAIGLCFYSITYIKNKKIFRFIICVLIASSFHDSSIVFFISYPLYHFKLKDASRYISIALIPIFYIFRVPLFNILSKIFKETATASENDSGLLFIVFSLVYMFCIVYTDESDNQNGLLNLFLVACLCQAFGNIYQTAMRVGYYFMMSLVLLLPSVLVNMRIKENKGIYIFIVSVAFIIFGLYSIHGSTWEMAYPYLFFWE